MPQGGLAIYHVDEKAPTLYNQGWPGMVCVCVCSSLLKGSPFLGFPTLTLHTPLVVQRLLL